MPLVVAAVAWSVDGSAQEAGTLTRHSSAGRACCGLPGGSASWPSYDGVLDGARAGAHSGPGSGQREGGRGGAVHRACARHAGRRVRGQRLGGNARRPAGSGWRPVRNARGRAPVPRYHASPGRGPVGGFRSNLRVDTDSSCSFCPSQRARRSELRW